MDIYNDSYSNYKVGGKCKRKVKTSHGTYRCVGTFDVAGVCVPCDAGNYPMIAPGGGTTPSKGWTRVGRPLLGGGRPGRPIGAGGAYSGFQGRPDRLWFNQSGAPTTTEAGISVAQYVMGLLGVGVLFFVIGYGYKLGREKA